MTPKFNLIIQELVTMVTNIALQAFSQQIDDSNHEMMNMITIQMANVFNPMIENIIAFYQALARQLD